MKHEKTETTDATRLKQPRVQVRIIFLCLFLVAMVAAGNYVLAKMSSKTVGTSTGTIAAYAVSATYGNTQALAINCNSGGSATASYQFTVSNQDNGKTAEVTVDYGIQITMPTSLPEGITVKIDDVSASVSSDRKTFTFENASWTFAAENAGQNSHTLTFTADPSVITANYTISNIQIIVNTVQRN